MASIFGFGFLLTCLSFLRNCSCINVELLNGLLDSVDTVDSFDIGDALSSKTQILNDTIPSFPAIANSTTKKSISNVSVQTPKNIKESADAKKSKYKTSKYKSETTSFQRTPLKSKSVKNSSTVKTTYGKVQSKVQKEDFVNIDEPEECLNDNDNPNDKEEAFSSGVSAIQNLTKEDTNNVVPFDKRAKSGKENKTLETESETIDRDDIDLKFLQELFDGKDVSMFEKNMSDTLRKRFLKSLRNKIYDREAKLKMFEDFENMGIDTEAKLRHLIDEKVHHEEESVRYKVSFPAFYHSVGTITLPIDDLVEPFEAWYAGELNMSGIDYYYGMDKTYQRGDIGKTGVVLKITPAHWKKKGNLDENTISCWYKEENKWTKRRAQTIVPLNIKKFEYVGLYRFNGVPSHKFKYQKQFGSKNNTYILHVTQSEPYKPLRYEMLGYDHLLRSHYDHYIIDYLAFESWKFDYKILQVPIGYKCVKKLEKLKSHFEANPMWDFLHDETPYHRELILNKTYNHFKKKHDKIYDDELENHKRKNIFRHNQRFVHSHNRAKLNYTLQLNHLSDTSDNEFEMMKGQGDMDSPTIQKEINQIPQLRIKIPKEPLPKNLDWRNYGAVTKVHSQSFCASCWAFSAIGVVEGAYALKNGNITEMSVQQLVDCTWGYENNGCRGGWAWRAFQFVKEHGLTTRASYGKYLAQEGYCHCDKNDKCDGISNKISYRTIERHDQKKTMLGCAMYGPGSVSINSSRKTFKFYSSGIYDDPKCGHKTDHAVVLVGYGEENGKKYWLIKNSCGMLWGNFGYIKVDMKNDLCGILQHGTLMLSLGNWKSSDTGKLPFENMKKQSHDTEEKVLDDLGYFYQDIDFHAMPEHVVSYIKIANSVTLTFR